MRPVQGAGSELLPWATVPAQPHVLVLYPIYIDSSTSRLGDKNLHLILSTDSRPLLFGYRGHGPGTHGLWPEPEGGRVASDVTPVDALRARQCALPTAWRPTPFREFVLKIHSRCDLVCDHCYVYTMNDQRWRGRPRTMSRRTMDQTAWRVAQHAHDNRIIAVDVVFHGGEPLLAGLDEIRYCVTRLRTEAGDGVDVRIKLQTNGTRLGGKHLQLFAELGIRVGVSLDGDRTAHNRHRRHPDGTGSYDTVIRALSELGRQPYAALFSGLLCTIDLRNDPVATYESLLEFAPPKIDFLLPHGNWSSPPPGRGPDTANTPYADWLIAVFERWYCAPVRETRVRILEEIMHVLAGGQSRVEGIGPGPVATVVVETDGSIEQSDMLTSAHHGAAATGLHVAHDSFDAALRLPVFVARQLGIAALSRTCQQCGVRRICGGGLYAHRYRNGSGFTHPSVYCPDMYRLITHIRQRLSRDITAVQKRS